MLTDAVCGREGEKEGENAIVPGLGLLVQACLVRSGRERRNEAWGVENR